jgi:hypothetical protein
MDAGNSFRTIVSENESPLFRIMWVFGANHPQRRHFDNNIITFHIGNGYFLSVAHNLRTECPLMRSIPNQVFEEQLAPMLSDSQRVHLERCFVMDKKSDTRFLELPDPNLANGVAETIRSTGFDTRWVGLGNAGICKPHLIMQFKDNALFGDPKVAEDFPNHYRFYESHIERHTFLIELELVKAFYSADISLYRMKTENLSLASKIPAVEIDFSVAEESRVRLFCLQSSPGGLLGRLLNNATIEGYLDQHQVFHDRIGGNYILEGFRYLIRGYFRFGSSGAPYLTYDDATRCFKANAVQSEASPVQLSINHSREGNFQYVNAIASPLMLIKDELKALQVV